MSRITIGMIAALWWAALFLACDSQAMEIRLFDQMADDDQNEYVADLIIGAQTVLRDAGKADRADQVHRLFGTKLLGDQISVGRAEFERNLARAREADVRRLEKDANARRLEVEDAMIVTLRKNGIELPPNFLTVASGFKPKLPLQAK